MLVSKTEVKAFLARDLDHFAWMKQLEKEDILRQFRSLKVKPEFKTDPWLHQLVCFYIGICYPQFLFLLDMGAGKTKIILDIFTQLVREKKLERGLIVVPRLINIGSWDDAITEHSNFGSNLVQGEIEEKWEILANPKNELTIIDNSGLQLALTKKEGKKLVKDERKIRQVRKLYQFLGLDESHKAKNKETLRFTLLRAISKMFEYRYATTGTLFGRNPEDAWAQFYLIDQGETFGETIGLFRAAFFQQSINRFTGYPEYKFDKSMMHTFYRMLNNRSIRYGEHELPEIPECHVIPMRLCFPDEQREYYNLAVEGLIQSKGKLKELDSNYIRMKQISSGYLSWTEDQEKCQVQFGNNPKLAALEKVIEESGDSKIVVSHEFTMSGKIITEFLTSIGVQYEWLYGGSKDKVGAVGRFLDNAKCKVFVMNSEAGGTGTDGLQKQARYLFIYDQIESPITRKQTIKRVHRSGQLHRSFVYEPLYQKSVDEKIRGNALAGQNLHQELVDGNISLNSLFV